EETCAELAKTARRDLIEGKTILELGSGTGLCGLLCAMVSGAECVLTDGSDDAVAELERAAALNAEACAVKCRVLQWGDEAALAALVAERGGEKFDVVLGTDVVYEGQFVAPLLRTACGALKDGGALVLANHKYRFRSFRDVIDQH